MGGPPLQADWPGEFDVAIYKASNPDLAGLNDYDAREHYRRIGRDEGRIASAVATREGLKALIAPQAKVLEIGPASIPAFRPGERDVRYVDVLTTAELRQKAARVRGADPMDVPEIDYVWTGGRLTDLIPERFDAVYSSHNIEHQTALASHLQDLGGLLRPGGAVYLVVPDMRYGLDHFLPASTMAEVLAAELEPTYRHRPLQVTRHAFFSTHNDPVRHWAGDHGPNPFERRLGPALGDLARELRKLYGRAEYVDAHAWQFTPETFRRLVADLHAGALSPLLPVRVYPTVRNAPEFFAVLTAG